MIAPCVCGYVEGVDDAVPAGEIVPRRGGQVNTMSGRSAAALVGSAIRSTSTSKVRREALRAPAVTEVELKGE
jgi:hypothetical protein